jgi:CheY-like chemotaxis protein
MDIMDRICLTRFVAAAAEPGFAGRVGSAGSAKGELALDMSKVLVVGKSRINQVVVSKIVEGLGLKPVPESPDGAARILMNLMPGAIVLDGGADNKDCEALMPAIAALRQASGRSKPSLILLSANTGADGNSTLSSLIDVVMAKPITPDKLQPVLKRLMAQPH